MATWGLGPVSAPCADVWAFGSLSQVWPGTGLRARTGPCGEDSSRGGFPSGPIGLGGPTGLGSPPGVPIPDMPLVGTRLQAVVVARQMSKRALPGPQRLVISQPVWAAHCQRHQLRPSAIACDRVRTKELSAE